MSVSSLTLNLAEGSVTFSFTPLAAAELKSELDGLMARSRAVSARATAGRAGKTPPQPPLEYRYTGDVFLEVFCNPNIWPTPFAAKVLVTLRDDRIRVSTETELTRVLDDLSQYLDRTA